VQRCCPLRVREVFFSSSQNPNQLSDSSQHREWNRLNFQYSLID
jgi:hypothetical protein